MLLWDSTNADSQRERLLPTSGFSTRFASSSSDKGTIAVKVLDIIVAAANGQALDQFISDFSQKVGLNPKEMMDICTGKAAIGHNLTRYFSTHLSSVAEKERLFLQAESARMGDLAIVEIDLMPQLETSRQRQSGVNPSKRGNFTGYPILTSASYSESEFLKILREKHKDISAKRPIDFNGFLAGLASKLLLDPWMLEGFAPISYHIKPAEAAEFFANILSADCPHEYERCYQAASNHFTSVQALDLINGIKFGYPHPAGRMLQTLRYNAGIRQEDMAAKIPPLIKAAASSSRYARRLLAAKSEIETYDICTISNIECQPRPNPVSVRACLDVIKPGKAVCHAIEQLAIKEYDSNRLLEIKEARDFGSLLNALIIHKFGSKERALREIQKKSATNDIGEQTLNYWVRSERIPDRQQMKVILQVLTPSIDDAQRLSIFRQELTNEIEAERKDSWDSIKDKITSFGEYVNVRKQNLSLSSQDLIDLVYSDNSPRKKLRQIVNNWEIDFVIPSPETITKIARALKLNRPEANKLHFLAGRQRVKNHEDFIRRMFTSPSYCYADIFRFIYKISGINAENLTNQVGLQKSTAKAVLSKSAHPSQADLKKLCSYFGLQCPIDELENLRIENLRNKSATNFFNPQIALLNKLIQSRFGSISAFIRKTRKTWPASETMQLDKLRKDLVTGRIPDRSTLILAAGTLALVNAEYQFLLSLFAVSSKKAQSQPSSSLPVKSNVRTSKAENLLTKYSAESGANFATYLKNLPALYGDPSLSAFARRVRLPVTTINNWIKAEAAGCIQEPGLLTLCQSLQFTREGILTVFALANGKIHLGTIPDLIQSARALYATSSKGLPSTKNIIIEKMQRDRINPEHYSDPATINRYFFITLFERSGLKVKNPLGRGSKNGKFIGNILSGASQVSFSVRDGAKIADPARAKYAASLFTSNPDLITQLGLIFLEIPNPPKHLELVADLKLGRIKLKDIIQQVRFSKFHTFNEAAKEIGIEAYQLRDLEHGLYLLKDESKMKSVLSYLGITAEFPGYQEIVESCTAGRKFTLPAAIT